MFGGYGQFGAQTITMAKIIINGATALRMVSGRVLVTAIHKEVFIQMGTLMKFKQINLGISLHKL